MTTLFQQKAPVIMADLMRDFALDVTSAAAIVGNLGHESGGFRFLQEKKPLVPGSRGGWGWAQWTGPRRRAFEAWVAAKGFDPSSDEANYGFLAHELRTSEAKAIPAVRAAGSLEDKVKAFELAFERAGVKHYPQRYDYARQALAAFNGEPMPAPAPASAKPKPPKLTSDRMSVPAGKWAEQTLAKYEVEAIQKRLRDLGYYMVGKVDGIWGPATAGALIALQTQAGITADGHWGPQTKAALDDDANRRKIPEARANTTASDLKAQGSTIVIQGSRVTWASVWQIVLVVLGGVQYLAQNWNGDLSSLGPAGALLGFLPPWVAPVLIVALNLYNAAAAQGIVKARVVAERTGLHNGEPDPAPSPPVTHAPDGPAIPGILGTLLGLRR